jgi:hypothetical protein
MLTRRQALARTVSAATMLACGRSATAIAPSARLRVGVIGCGFRGKYLIANLPPVAHVVAICDCDRRRMELTRQPQGEFAGVLADFAAGDGRHVVMFQDYRRLLDDVRLDAVVIAAPDHHHVAMAIAACAAGLDVYVEKPLSLTIAEGRRLVNTARRTGRVVQVGSQQRSMQVNRLGCEFLRTGGLGRIHLIEAMNYPGPLSQPAFPVESVPAELDWNLFCGPAPLPPYHWQRWVKDEFRVSDLLWRGWDLWRDFSGHMMTNWGAHSLDMVQLALGRDAGGPTEVRPMPDLIASGIDVEWKSKTPPRGYAADPVEDRMRFCPVEFRYVDGPVLRLTPGVKDLVFHGDRGKLFMSRNKFRTEPVELAPEIDLEEARQWEGTGNVARPHLQNWLDCIASRGVPNAPLEAGHRTATVCHLANLARQVGRPLTWNPDTEQFENDAAANALLDRPRRAGFEWPV